MAFIIYAALFRLAVIAAGTACVVMGYRLFVLGVMPRDASDVEASAGEIRLTVKNAAPGTCFALFGAFIIGIMLVQGNPEQRREENLGSDSRSYTVRGENAVLSTQTYRRGREQEEAGNLNEAIRSYARVLSEPSLTLEQAVEPLTGLARIYWRQERYPEALAYARLVRQVRKEDAGVLALIGRIERDQGNVDAAIAAMKRAAMWPTPTRGAV